MLIAVDGYRFGSKEVDRLPVVADLRQQLPTVRHAVVIRHLHPGGALPAGALAFDELVARDAAPAYEQVPFDHSLWILYSSGTTGLPKGIVHSHGGRSGAAPGGRGRERAVPRKRRRPQGKLRQATGVTELWRALSRWGKMAG